jgi:hypothetical protein
MREKLNSNPVMQIALIGVLLVAGGLFVMSTLGGGAETEEPAPAESTSLTTEPAATGAEGLPIPSASASAAVPSVGASAQTPPKLPKAVVEAWESNRTVVLLFVRDGGIDDHLVRETVDNLAALSAVRAFVVPAARVSDYTAVTEGVGVERVPALVVLTPKRIDDTAPMASVHYGFQSPAAVAQAVIDAGYEGPTVDYHP